jgi:hypothetical protein
MLLMSKKYTAFLILTIATWAQSDAVFARVYEPIPVEIWRGGDDGLTNKLSDAIESAFAVSDAFVLNKGEKNKMLTVTIPTNVHRERVDNHNEVLYTVELKQKATLRTATISGSCRENKLSICADQIFRSAQALVRGVIYSNNFKSK